MSQRGFRAIFGLTAVLVGLGLGSAYAQTIALSGRVSSQDEGNMEGVVVSAKRAGSTITVSRANPAGR
jgi:hypothetical protein